MFDINDFDETLPGPWEWDMKRLAASFEVMGRYSRLLARDRRAIVMAGVQGYREGMLIAAGRRTLDVWYDHLEAGKLLDSVAEEVRKGELGKKSAAKARDYIAKARTRDSVRVLSRRAEKVDGELRIVADPPLIVPLEDLIVARLRVGAGGRPHQGAAVVVSTHAGRRAPPDRGIPVRPRGPQGRRRRKRRHPLLHPLARGPRRQRSAVPPGEGGAGIGTRALCRCDASTRTTASAVVAGQRLMQAATDIFLGWQRIKGLDGETRDYYVRQLHDWKGSVDIEVLRRARGAVLQPDLWRDACACARPVGRPDRDRVVPRQERCLRRAIADFSATYADQNERDYQTLLEAVKSGRISAQTGV